MLVSRTVKNLISNSPLTGLVSVANDPQTTPTRNFHMTTFSEIGRPEPNIVHIRLYDEDNNLLPHGGATYAFLLLMKDGQLTAEVGIAVCSDEDNFNKRIGAKIAAARLVKHLTQSPDDDELWFSMDHTLASHAMLANMNISPTILPSGAPADSPYVSVRNDELAYEDELTRAVKTYITKVRTETYFGSNDDIQEEIDARFEAEQELDLDEDEEDGDDSDDEDGQEGVPEAYRV